MAAAKKVLVIDDDAAACGLIDGVLTRLGLEVLTMPDPRVGYETAMVNMPDLIFINLLLPGTNGLKVSKSIHAVKGLEMIPVIMLISYQGELDPKYTATIGILDTLVKPLKEAEIIAKTRAILGDAAVTELEDKTVREICLEEEMKPLILYEEEEMAEEAELVSAAVTLGESVKEERPDQDEREIVSKMIKEGESHMAEKENPFDKKEDDERDLFTDESDIFGEELKESHAGGEKGPKQVKQEDDSFPEEDVAPSYGEEKPASPIRRILLIAVSIVVGIGLGVGGYFFFTAGSKHAPVEKQIARTLPEPAPVAALPVIPSDKPNVIPEIPVKSEPQKSETAQAKEAPVQKAEAEKPMKETAPVSTAKPEEKKLVSPGHAAKEATASIKAKQAYYVQTGLFVNEVNAKVMADKLKQKGYAPSVKKVEAKDNQVIFRVTAGTYDNFKKAVEVSETLNKQGISALVHKQ